MRVDGEWFHCDDGIERPVVRGRVRAADGSWVQALFLIDTGAARTVISWNVLQALSLSGIETDDRIGGVGGMVDSVVVETFLQLFLDSGGELTFRGHYAGVTDSGSLDMSVLGRDITSLFGVIVDRPGDIVCLIGQRHRYIVVSD